MEAAIAATLPPDLYTVLLAGLNKGTGNGLVEVYDLADGDTIPDADTWNLADPVADADPDPRGADTDAVTRGDDTDPNATAAESDADASERDRAWRTSMASRACRRGGSATIADGPPPLWAISTTSSDSAPNNAFVSDTAVISDKRLDSRPIVISSAAAQISFRNNYDFEFSDGDVLGRGSVGSIDQWGTVCGCDRSLDLGGTFCERGLQRNDRRDGGQPALGSQPAWASSSGGYITSAINLGAALAGAKHRAALADGNRPGDRRAGVARRQPHRSRADRVLRNLRETPAF